MRERFSDQYLPRRIIKSHPRPYPGTSKKRGSPKGLPPKKLVSIISYLLHALLAPAEGVLKHFTRGSTSSSSNSAPLSIIQRIIAFHSFSLLPRRTHISSVLWQPMQVVGTCSAHLSATANPGARNTKFTKINKSTNLNLRVTLSS